MNTFDAKREGSGTYEWAEVTENIARGCPHNCLYCYAAQNAKRFKLRDRNEWSREELTKRADITSYPSRFGVIMFPSGCPRHYAVQRCDLYSSCAFDA